MISFCQSVFIKDYDDDDDDDDELCQKLEKINKFVQVGYLGNHKYLYLKPI